jgi:hypothetical protein
VQWKAVGAWRPQVRNTVPHTVRMPRVRLSFNVIVDTQPARHKSFSCTDGELKRDAYEPQKFYYLELFWLFTFDEIAPEMVHFCPGASLNAVYLYT